MGRGDRDASIAHQCHLRDHIDVVIKSVRTKCIVSRNLCD